jgi:hypothetical protein
MPLRPITWRLPGCCGHAQLRLVLLVHHGAGLLAIADAVDLVVKEALLPEEPARADLRG